MSKVLNIKEEIGIKNISEDVLCYPKTHGNREYRIKTIVKLFLDNIVSVLMTDRFRLHYARPTICVNNNVAEETNCTLFDEQSVRVL